MALETCLDKLAVAGELQRTLKNVTMMDGWYANVCAVTSQRNSITSIDCHQTQAAYYGYTPYYYNYLSSIPTRHLAVLLDVNAKQTVIDAYEKT